MSLAFRELHTGSPATVPEAQESPGSEEPRCLLHDARPPIVSKIPRRPREERAVERRVECTELDSTVQRGEPPDLSGERARDVVDLGSGLQLGRETSIDPESARLDASLDQRLPRVAGGAPSGWGAGRVIAVRERDLDDGVPARIEAGRLGVHHDPKPRRGSDGQDDRSRC